MGEGEVVGKVTMSKNFKCCCFFYRSGFAHFGDYQIYLKPGQTDSLTNAKTFASQNYYYDEIAVYDQFGNYYPIKK